MEFPVFSSSEDAVASFEAFRPHLGKSMRATKGVSVSKLVLLDVVIRLLQEEEQLSVARIIERAMPLYNGVPRDTVKKAVFDLKDMYCRWFRGQPKPDPIALTCLEASVEAVIDLRAARRHPSRISITIGGVQIVIDTKPAP